MSNPQQSATKPIGSVDPGSRYRLRWFALRLLGLVALVFGLCLFSARPIQEGAALLSLACSMGGFVSMAFAKLRGEPLWQGSLNGWDEALAFVAIARLAHFAMGIPA